MVDAKTDDALDDEDIKPNVLTIVDDNSIEFHDMSATDIETTVAKNESMPKQTLTEQNSKIFNEIVDPLAQSTIITSNTKNTMQASTSSSFAHIENEVNSQRSVRTSKGTFSS